MPLTQDTDPSHDTSPGEKAYFIINQGNDLARTLNEMVIAYNQRKRIAHVCPLVRGTLVIFAPIAKPDH